MKNISPRTVTAWAYSVVAQYADGSTQTTSVTMDALSDLLPGGHAFSTNVTRNLEASFPLDGHGNLPAAANATMKMIVFDDLSALGDSVEIRRLASSRRSGAEHVNKVLDDIQRVRQTADPKKAWKNYIDENKLNNQIMFVQLLAQFDRGPEAVDRVVSSYKAYRDLLSRSAAIHAAQ